MNSRVHPKYKTKYRVSNWREYDRGLVRRGQVTFWLSPEAVAAWSPRPGGRRGGQRRYSDLAIETALTLRLVFHLPLRQVEGFLRSLFALMDVDLDVPDHTTLSRRSKALRVDLRGALAQEPIHLIADSTGLSIVGEGERAAAKHGGKGRRGWRKLHLAVDRAGVIVAETLTPGSADDAGQVGELLEAVRWGLRGSRAMPRTTPARWTRARRPTARRSSCRPVPPRGHRAGGQRRVPVTGPSGESGRSDDDGG
jgi:hypothetical protein